MGTGREHDVELKDRVGRLMAFLRELVASRSRPVLSLQSHPGYYWLAGALGFAQIDPLAAAGQAVLRAPRISLDPAPELPAQLHGWIDLRDRDDSSLEQPPLKPTGPDPAGGPERVEADAVPGLHSAYHAWAGGWRRWAEVDRLRRPQHELHRSLATMRQQLLDQPESYELVVASGLLEVSSRDGAEAISTHLVTQAATVEQDPETGDLLCVFASDATISLEDSQLLTGHPVFDPSGTSYLRDRLTESVASALDPEVLGFLKEWAGRAATIAVDVGDDTARMSMPRLRPAPALVLRKRGAFALLNYYDQMIHAAERPDEPVPLGIAQLVEAIEPEDRLTWLERTGAAAAADLAHDPLFPLPANEEQAQIITRLGGDSGVVVEGPPGTGKTHTIANLMSSLLASGQRILVTSEKAQALRVIREKLPEEMQELCVSITDVARGGSAELSRSVASLAARKSGFNPAADERTVRDLDQKRRELKQRRASTLEAIRALRESETYQHPEIASGYAGTAATIARAVTERRPELGWVPIPVEGDLPLTAAQLHELVQLQARLTPAHATRRGQTFPSANALPSAGAVRDLAGQVAAGNTAARGVDERVRELIDRSEMDLLDLVALLRDTEDVLARVRVVRDPWPRNLADTVLSRRDPYLWSRAAEHATYVNGAVVADQHLGLTRIDGLDAPTDDARRAFNALADHLQAGGTLKKMFKSDAQKAAEPWLATVQVDGQPVATAAQARQVQAHLDVYANARALQQLLAPLEVPVPTDGPRAVLVSQLLAVREGLAAVEAVVAAVDRLAEALGSSHRALPASTAEVERLCADASALIATHSAGLATAELGRLAEMVDAVVPYGGAAPELARLSAALREADADAYDVGLAALEEGNRLHTEAMRHAELRGRLLGVSVGLVRLVEAGGDEETWARRIDAWPEAWAWGCAATWVERMSDPDRDADLNDNLAQLDADLGQVTAELAAAKAWQAALMRMTASQVQALQAYRDNLTNVGMGTGKYAERYRQAARSAMETAQGAVPAWVMPLQQVLASIPAQQNAFDVVIVDEASQADITSLFLLYLAPRVIVVGDDKQCTPSEVSAGSLDKVFDRLDSYLHDVPAHLRATLTPRSSIFSMLRTRFGQVVRLREHFRCMPEIITWSSQMFYRDAPLVPMRQFGADRLPPLRTTYVAGGYSEGRYARLHNPVEAEAIVETIEACLADPAYDDKTFGVVVLQGQSQVDVIRNALINRIPGEVMEERRLRVGTPPDFQGDERHIVLLSMVVGPEQRFATLTKNEYQRRFNVAASRAQDQLWLFHSVTPDRLSNADLRHSLLTYMQAAHSGATLPVPEGVTRDRRHRAFDSLFEQRVFLDLVGAGYHVTPQVEVNHRRIDLVVTGRGSKLAVECDGDAWHSSPEQVQSDLDRELELRRCGWTFWRVRESEYYLDSQRALSTLWTTLDELGIGPFQADDELGAQGAASNNDVWTPGPLPDDESPLGEEELLEPAPAIGPTKGSAVTQAPAVSVGAFVQPEASAALVVTREVQVGARQPDFRRTSAQDPASGRATVLELAAQGPISNGDVREATGLEGNRVLELLRGLMAEGVLYRTGAKRGTRYHLADGAPVPTTAREVVVPTDPEPSAREAGSMHRAEDTDERPSEDYLDDLPAVQWIEADKADEPVYASDDASEPTAETMTGLSVISRWLTDLTERQLGILQLRTVAGEPWTLDELGEHHGVTRERIRQIESKLIADARALLARGPQAELLQTAVSDFQDECGALAPLPDSLGALGLTQRVLVWLAGYVVDDGCVRRQAFELPTAGEVPLLGDGPVLDRDQLLQTLRQRGVHDDHLDGAVARIPGVQAVDGALVLWPRSAVERCLAVLTVQGEPMSVEQLIEAVGENLSIRSVRQRLYEDPRVVRASRNTVGLAAWGGSVYTSVANLMRRALADGPRTVSDLGAVLAEEYDVSPSSVATYSRAPAFVVEGAVVRLRGDGEPYPVRNRPAEVPGLYLQDDDTLIWHQTVDAEILRGSGRPVPQEVAAHLGVSPGDQLDLHHPLRTVALTWPHESHVGPHLGSIKALVDDLGLQAGDIARLRFTRSGPALVVEGVTQARLGESPVETVARLTGLPPAKSASRRILAGAVGCDTSALVGVLRLRGDHGVAEAVTFLPS
ncbi:AAA domain-containing protein [Nocardioides pacificus]